MPNILVSPGDSPWAQQLVRQIANANTRIFVHQQGPCELPATCVDLPNSQDPEFSRCISEYAQEQKIDQVLVLNSSTHEALGAALQFAAFSQITPASAAGACSDLFRLFVRCLSVVDCARTEVFRGGRPRGSGPWYVRPRLAEDPRERFLMSKTSELLGVPTDGTFILQEFLPGDPTIVDLWVTDSGKILFDNHQVLTEQAGRVARHLDLRGPASLEFRDDRDGRSCLVSVLPRMNKHFSISLAQAALGDAHGAQEGC